MLWAAIASLACHYTAPYTPSALDIERNQHFARLISITLKGGSPPSLAKPVFVQPADRTLRPPAAAVNSN